MVSIGPRSYLNNMMIDPVTILAAVGAISKMFIRNAEKASEDKASYAEKLENASGDDVFKYILLINVAALEGYVAQTRLQAQQSFRLSTLVASVGFILISVGIGFAFYVNLAGKGTLDAAYLSSIAGLLTEFIAGVFFYLYNRTLQQVNRFHDKLVAMQQLSMAFLATSLVTDASKRDEAKIGISMAIVPGTAPTPTKEGSIPTAA